MTIQRGKNNVSISCTLELINYIKTYAGQADQNEGFWLMTQMLTNNDWFKKTFTEKYGKEVYDKMVQHYSKTNLQQRTERALEEETKEIKTDAKQQEKERMKAFWIDKLKNGNDTIKGNAERHLKFDFGVTDEEIQVLIEKAKA